ncbi:hypothetical protein NIES2135_61390 (plasmid) [Leptolyngbya boryana NIES-2135]|uniref:Uncharacterized protein n=1 Tax=Leptolyngbya boryana NIES-2135 TaxID=1973484 RepID=A0A1Z4JRA5_LEPBY|nr:hypothetical protein NIES2135_61390 [Leptolyngbya boryana NIES-2135]
MGCLRFFFSRDSSREISRELQILVSDRAVQFQVVAATGIE